MAEAASLTTQPRRSATKEASRLRRKGIVPPGGPVRPQEGNGQYRLAGQSTGKSHPPRRPRHRPEDRQLQAALIKEVQWDHLGKDMLHVDFARVAPTSASS